MSASSDDSLGGSDDGGLDNLETSERSRDLLSSFYGSMAPPPADEPEDDEPAAPLDRTDFDADAYVRDLLKTRPLDRLLEHDDGLRREVKTLGSDLQSLVYENYSKFIGATDTIRDMKENVGAMEAEVAKLSATMADVDARSARVRRPGRASRGAFLREVERSKPIARPRPRRGGAAAATRICRRRAAAPPRGASRIFGGERRLLSRRRQNVSKLPFANALRTQVNSSLAAKRAQIDKLVRARRLLKRLEFLFELPRKLGDAVGGPGGHRRGAFEMRGPGALSTPRGSRGVAASARRNIRPAAATAPRRATIHLKRLLARRNIRLAAAAAPRRRPPTIRAKRPRHPVKRGPERITEAGSPRRWPRATSTARSRYMSRPTACYRNTATSRRYGTSTRTRAASSAV